MNAQEKQGNQGRHFLLKQTFPVTFSAIGDILPAGHGAKTDLFAFATHSAPVIIAIVTEELKPRAIWAFSHVNNYCSLGPTQAQDHHQTRGSKKDQTKQINLSTQLGREKSLDSHSLDCGLV